MTCLQRPSKQTAPTVTDTRTPTRASPSRAAARAGAGAQAGGGGHRACDRAVAPRLALRPREDRHTVADLVRHLEGVYSRDMGRGNSGGGRGSRLLSHRSVELPGCSGGARALPGPRPRRARACVPGGGAHRHKVAARGEAPARVQDHVVHPCPPQNGSNAPAPSVTTRARPPPPLHGQPSPTPTTAPAPRPPHGGRGCTALGVQPRDALLV